MEKHHPHLHKAKNNFMKFLSKPAPFSPNRDKRSDHKRVKPHAGAGKGFSGQIISIIPDEARRRSKSGRYDTPEPNSPKISCMGQIKHKKNQTVRNQKSSAAADVAAPRRNVSDKVPKKRSSAIKKLWSGSFKADHGRRRSDASVYDKQPLSADRAPPLSQLKRFASGRDSLGDFDWVTAQVITPFGTDQRNYYSDGDEDDEEEDEEVIIPFSAPMMIGGLEPRKEVNLWKRRTMDPPRPLQLNLVDTFFFA
ncbi:hypothetical protein M5689_024966 [Euphorbia peplus]|nr:hypothetical protein M5689_024966 [Euphorbia peplus]